MAGVRKRAICRECGTMGLSHFDVLQTILSCAVSWLCGNNAILTCAGFLLLLLLVDRRIRVLSRAFVGTLGCHFCSTVETLGVAWHCFASLVRFAGACCTCSFSYCRCALATAKQML